MLRMQRPGLTRKLREYEKIDAEWVNQVSCGGGWWALRAVKRITRVAISVHSLSHRPVRFDLGLMAT